VGPRVQRLRRGLAGGARRSAAAERGRRGAGGVGVGRDAGGLRPKAERGARGEASPGWAASYCWAKTTREKEKRAFLFISE